MELFQNVSRSSGLVQIAGAASLAEARAVLDCGADLLGFPLRLDHNAPDLSEAACADVVRALGRPQACCLITYLDRAGEIVALANYLGVGAVQLHGPLPARELARVRELNPGLGLIKSLVVGRWSEEELIREMEELAPHADAFITDTYNPATGASGATGLVHDWAVSRRLTEFSPRPVILAGGLHPGNVAAAVLAVRPAGVDAHTGLEDASGRKDPALMRAFVRESRAAFAALARSSG